MKFAATLIAIVVAVAVLSSCRGEARTYYVSTTGSDTATGTTNQPWRTLRKGLTALMPGDTLYIHGGTYTERLNDIAIVPGSRDLPIRVAACPGEKPELKGLLWLKEPSYWTVDGLNVSWDPATGQPNEHMVKLTNGVGWTLENADISGACSYAAVLVAGGKSGEPDDWRICNNRIHDTHRANKINQDHLIYVNTGLDAGHGIVERNLVFNCENGSGIKLGGPKLVGGSVNVVVRFNTIYNTVDSVLVAGLSHDNQIYGNLLGKTDKTYSGIRGYRLSGHGNVARDNGFFETRGAIHNDAGYPGIVDAGGNNMVKDDRLVARVHHVDEKPGVASDVPIGFAAPAYFVQGP